MENADAAKAIILRSGGVDNTETRRSEMNLESVVAVMTYPLAALSVGLVSLPLFVVWRLVKASVRIGIWDLVFLGLLGLIFLINGVGDFIGPWVTNLIFILPGVGR
jgi:nitrate reductase NapE component